MWGTTQNREKSDIFSIIAKSIFPVLTSPTYYMTICVWDLQQLYRKCDFEKSAFKVSNQQPYNYHQNQKLQDFCGKYQISQKTAWRWQKTVKVHEKPNKFKIHKHISFQISSLCNKCLHLEIIPCDLFPVCQQTFFDCRNLTRKFTFHSWRIYWKLFT